MLKDLVDALRGEVNTRHLLELTESVWRLDRRFTFPAFAESAALEVATMGSFGLEAEVIEAPADGLTVMGEWRMPMAWDYERAWMEIVSPERAKGVLADTDVTPAHIVMWSGPTPGDGITAPLIHVPKADKPESYEGIVVRGKVVLTDTEARLAKMEAAQRGAAALVSFYSSQPERLPRAIFWVNGWSDDPGGWAFHEGDTPLPALSLSPVAGRDLVALLSGQEEVLVRLVVDSRTYQGTVPLATGLLRGSNGTEEVLAIGHGHEQGANDNASGVAVMMEALRAIKSLVQKGKLRRPARSIRALVTNECYGTFAFAAMRPDVVRRTVAAINVDSVGQDQTQCEAVMQVRLNPHASAHFSDTLIVRLFEDWVTHEKPHFAFRILGYSLVDNGLSDPAYGVPTVLIDSKDVNWHTTEDTMEKVSPENITEMCVLTAAFLYYIAAAGEGESRALAADSAARWLNILGDAFASGLKDAAAAKDEERAIVMAGAAQQVTYLTNVAMAELESTERLVTRQAETRHQDFLTGLKEAIVDTAQGLVRGISGTARLLAQLEGEEPAVVAAESLDERLGAAEEVIPVRMFQGPPCYDSLPSEVRRNTPSPRWDSSVHSACFRMDGKRTLAEVARLASLETGADPTKLIEQAELMARHGLVELRPKV